MSLLTVALVIIVVGVLLYVVNKYVPMDAKVLKILNIVVVLTLIIWLLKVFGVMAYISGVKI